MGLDVYVPRVSYLTVGTDYGGMSWDKLGKWQGRAQSSQKSQYDKTATSDLRMEIL